MTKEAQSNLELVDLARERPGLTAVFGAVLAEAASVCLVEEGHEPGVTFAASGTFSREFELQWGDLPSVAPKCWADSEVATEHGAYGLAALVVEALTGLTVIERSRKGTGFDFWLGSAAEEPAFFQDTTRLEVSGIRNGSDSTVSARVRQKLRQTGQSDAMGLPALVVVVEFGTPRSVVERR